MALRECRWFCVAVWLSLVAGGFFSAGCRTVAENPLFTASGPGWRVRQGQALWRPGRNYPELGGEVVVASHPDGRCAVQFLKMTIPMVLAQTSSTNWLIEFPPRQMSFSGKNSPPPRFLWLYLRAALADEALPGRLHFSRKPDGGWKLENVRSGESVEGYLEP
jgi:hypothetical protein